MTDALKLVADSMAVRLAPSVECFDSWSEHLFFQAWLESNQISIQALDLMFWDILREVLSAAFADPANWKPVRLRRDARTMAGARRVTRALRRAKPGQLVRL